MRNRERLLSVPLASLVLILTMVSIASATPFAYIPNYGDKTISVIDTATDNVVDTANIGFGGYGIAVNSNGTRVYLVERGTSNNDTIDVFDTNTNNITAKIPTGYKILGVAVDPDGKKVYATGYLSNTVSVIDTATNNVSTTIMDVGDRPTGVAVSPDGKKVYVANAPGFNKEGSVSVIDTSTNNLTNTIMLGENDSIFYIAVNPANEKQIYVANTGTIIGTAANICTIDTVTNNVTAKVKVKYSVEGLDVSPDGTKLYAVTTNLSNPPPYLGTVDVINTSTHTIIAVPVGHFPNGISVTPDGSKVYVTNTYSNNVSIIDTGTNTVIKSKNVGKYPQAFGRFIAPSTFTITPSKIRISDNVQCNASQIVDLSKDRIFWDFGDGTTDDSGNPVVNHSYSKLGSYKVTLTVEDSTGNVYTTSRFVHVTIPVVLVHGWRSSPVVWNNMTNRLQQEGFEVWNFDYERFNTFDPLVIAPNLSDFIDTQRNNLTYNGQEYNGPIDIVCHSMGAIVSRYYMEDLNGGIHGKDVRQWIGIAPAHHGSAGADLFASIPVFSSNILLKNLKLVFLGRAVNELTTYSFAVESLGPLSPTTKYRVIAGWNPNHSKDFGVGPLSATVAKRISGSGFPYYWTYSGDMIVATAQSYDPAMGFDAFPIGGILGNLPAHEFDHVHIHSSPTVIETVTRYLKDINKSSSNVLPPDDEIPFGNLSLSQKVISGLLNNDVQHVPIIFENIVPFANSSDLNHIESNAGSKLQLNSISMTTHQGTASSPENALVTLLDWDDGDINMTLTSPSGIEYSANSHPNNTWYTKDGNSLNYIITNPESGNWTVNLTPTNYPGHDIHYNLTYVVQTINASESGVLPIANFTSNVTEGFVPLSVNFTDLSTYATSLYWDFGDGNNSIGSTPTHTYTTVGNYMVNLTAINKNGTNSTFAKINVLEQPEKPILPIANFSSNVTSGYAPLTVQFTDLSGNATGWNWSFGNRAKSSQQNSTYTYFLIGNYTVNLTVSNENGTDSKIATIMVKQPEGTTPYAYITNSGSSNISVIDTTTDTVKATINVSSSPEGIAVNSAGTKVYVANGGNNTVSVIDTASNAVTADISVGQGPRGVAVTPDGTKVYVTNAVDNDVSVIDTSTNKPIKRVPVVFQPFGVAVSTDGTKVYVSNTGTTHLSVINTSTDNVTATIPVGFLPQDIAFTRDGTKAYVPNFRHSVSVIDTSTDRALTPIQVGTNPQGVAVSPDGTKVYVTNGIDNTISVIDTANNNITTINVGDRPQGVAITPDGTKIYVANRFSNNVSVIDTKTNIPMAEVPVGVYPSAFGQFIGSVPQLTLPVANFSTNVTNGYVPLSVQFIDLSINTTAWNWDFGDGSTSTNSTPTHIYSTVGSYIVNLTAINRNGTDSKTAIINVLKATPTITWNSPADITYGIPLNSTQLNAAALVPGNFNYTPPSGTVLSAGNNQLLHVNFTPTDTINYNNTSADVKINVLKATPRITWSNPNDIVYGTPLSDTQLNAIASVPGTFVYRPPEGTILGVGTQTLNTVFTPTDTANYTTAAASVSINVNALPPSVKNFSLNPNPPTIDQPFSVLVQVQNPPPNGSIQVIVDNGPVRRAPIDSNGTAVINGLTVSTAGQNYLDVGILNSEGVKITDNVYTFTAVLPTPTITWSNPDDIVYGTPLSDTQLNATASVPGTFVYTPPAGTILVVGTQTLNTVFTPTDTSNHTTATASVSINVIQATPTITWSKPDDIIYGTPLNRTQLNATASVPGNFNYTPPLGTILSVGAQTLQVKFTPYDTLNYTIASKSATITVLTPMQAIQQTINYVKGLVSSGELNSGPGDSLIDTLNTSKADLNRGNTLAATTELKAFIAQVKVYINLGILSPTKGQKLINEANDIINAIAILSKQKQLERTRHTIESKRMRSHLTSLQ